MCSAEVENVVAYLIANYSSIRGMKLTPFLRRNLISVRRNTLTR